MLDKKICQRCLHWVQSDNVRWDVQGYIHCKAMWEKTQEMVKKGMFIPRGDMIDVRDGPPSECYFLVEQVMSIQED